jgi:Protein of unknown function (DUF3040)
MEAAVMSLSTREQQALDGIENRLAGSDPKLTALLATFTRLTSGEGMPVCEEVHQEARWTGQVVRRACRLLAAYAGLDRALALLWVLMAVGLIAAGVALSDSGGGGACVRSRAVGCAATVPAYAARTVPSGS